MMWTDDPVRDADNYTYEQELEREKLPCCDVCGDYVDTELYLDLPGIGLVCERCMDKYQKRNW